jgi:hypothetical protein
MRFERVQARVLEARRSDSAAGLKPYYSCRWLLGRRLERKPKTQLQLPHRTRATDLAK